MAGKERNRPRSSCNYLSSDPEAPPTTSGCGVLARSRDREKGQSHRVAFAGDARLMGTKRECSGRCPFGTKSRW